MQNTLEYKGLKPLHFMIDLSGVSNYNYTTLASDVWAVANAVNFTGKFHLLGHDHGAMLGFTCVSITLGCIMRIVTVPVWCVAAPALGTLPQASRLFWLLLVLLPRTLVVMKHRRRTRGVCTQGVASVC